MSSTFHGLEVARRALNTQQAALYTTGHNIANANTPGYTRQRVNFQTTSPYPAPSINRPQIPGQIGTGVQAGSVQRVRDSFIDDQFRGENNKLGYWSARSQALTSMEVIMNEPTEQGLANTLDQFWQGLQDLSVTPQDSGTRSVVRQRGQAVVDTFNYLSQSLSAVQEDYKTEIDVTQKAINSIIRQINDVNKQISAVEVHGLLPNDLYDQRDLLIDDLSSYINIKVDPQKSGGLSSSIAEGTYDIYLADQNGNVLTDDSDPGKEIKLVDTSTNQAIGIHIQYNSEDPSVQSMNFLKLHPTGEGHDGFLEDPDVTEPNYSFDSFKTYQENSSGSLKAFIEAYGYTTKTTDENEVEIEIVKGLYTDMLRHLDDMAFTFATEFNKVHKSGWSLAELSDPALSDGKTEGEGKSFFSLPSNLNPTGAAKGIQIHQDIRDSTDNIAAAAEEGNQAYAGSGLNAAKLANVKDAVLQYGTSTTSVTSFYQSVIGDMGVKASQANQMANNSNVLRESALTRRDSVSSVSLDEEMTNMIQFQHAYNAAARNITMIDEMLDRIINNMGVVGR